MSSGTDPYATVLVFARYLEQSPLERAVYVEQQRRAATRPGGFNPYSKFCAACRAGFRFGGHQDRMTDAVSTVHPRYRPLYGQLALGYRRYLAGLRDLDACSETRVRTGVLVRSGLVLKLNPHLGCDAATDGSKSPTCGSMPTGPSRRTLPPYCGCWPRAWTRSTLEAAPLSWTFDAVRPTAL